VFEDYTYERLLADVLSNAPRGIDTRQGSIFYDAVAGPLFKIAKLYTDLDLIMGLCSIATATDDALDMRAGEFGLTRLAATRAKYHATFEGVAPEAGERFYYDGNYFVLRYHEERDLFYLEAEAAGIGGNGIDNGTPAVPVNHIAGLVSATFGDIYEYGTDRESDENLRKRVKDKVAGPAENGNRQHYKTWCESIEGVGRARITPLWNGPNTVKAVLIDSIGRPCSELKVAEVQKEIDPADKGMTVTIGDRTYTVGDGLGNGLANIGAHFTAVGASPLEITVSFCAEFAEGTAGENVGKKAEEEIGEYLKGLVFDAEDGEAVIVRVSAVGGILSRIKGLVDYTDLQLNGNTHNLTAGEDDVPVLKEVRILG
jgi:uncharacterized phage protein gp47/JayE